MAKRRRATSINDTFEGFSKTDDEGASNRLVNVESLSEKELDTLHRHCAEQAKRALGRRQHHRIVFG